MFSSETASSRSMSCPLAALCHDCTAHTAWDVCNELLLMDLSLVIFPLRAARLESVLSSFLPNSNLSITRLITDDLTLRTIMTIDECTFGVGNECSRGFKRSANADAPRPGTSTQHPP